MHGYKWPIHCTRTRTGAAAAAGGEGGGRRSMKAELESRHDGGAPEFAAHFSPAPAAAGHAVSPYLAAAEKLVCSHTDSVSVSQPYMGASTINPTF